MTRLGNPSLAPLAGTTASNPLTSIQSSVMPVGAYAAPFSSHQQHDQQQQQQTRLMSSRRGYDWDPDEDKPAKSKNFLEKAADKVKSFLPAKMFQSEEEQQAAIQKKRRQEEISGSIDQVFKDAPLGMRLMGKMAGKVFSSVASGLAETMEESARQMEDLLMDARSYIVADGMATELLGEPIEVGPPFSQSSSTSIINGQKSVNIQASFEVVGSRNRGVATMVASGSGIQRLNLNVAGRSFDVGTTGRVGGGGSTSSRASVSGSTYGKPGMRKGDVIDAEIIDAEYTEKKQ